MKIWIIDDEQPCLDELAWQLGLYPDLEIIGMDTNPSKAMEEMSCLQPDAVFLDIDMPKIDGLELALHIQEKYPGIIVIFVTAYAQYALEAYKAHPLDFLLKPVNRKRLDNCVSHLHRHYALLHPDKQIGHSLAIRCFGTFEMICETDIKWGTRRVRELFLYLINKNGHSVSKHELLCELFGGQNDKSAVHNLYMTIYRLKCLLCPIDPEQKLIRLTGDNVLILSPGVCDYTDFMSFAQKNAVITKENASEAARVLLLYRGTYLEKESYEWAQENAYAAETEYERIALALGSFYIAMGQLTEAESVLTTLLMHNALCEEAHAQLLDLALKANDRNAYMIRYEQYAQIMKKELGVKPGARYRTQYERMKRE